jgi:hypothetical protein
MKKLLLLDDVPAGRAEPASVAFSHALYAELLRDVLADNRAGICVGFFARWGQGKSTVINLLPPLISNTARLVVFNAYQARGDSVRRQMLLRVVRELDPKRADELERFTQVEMPFDLRSASARDSHNPKEVLRLLFVSRSDPWLTAAAVAFALFGGPLLWLGGSILFTSAAFQDKDKYIVGLLAATCASFGGFIWRWIQKRQDQIIAYTQPVSESQRLKYPEQFSRLFRETVQEFTSKNKKKVVLVVDDLDRCEPATVVEALASVRQFCHGDLGELNCQFLMPCDEKQMVKALENDGHEYGAELLRKFFDVIVRMDEIVPESLADFAAVQAAAIGVDPMLARDMVDAGAVREPRKVKSLLNSFRLAREAVMRNENAGRLPPADQLARLDQTLAALVSLQELAPHTYAAVALDPDLLDAAELGGAAEPVARRIIAGLGPISIATADILITKQNEPSLRGLATAHALTAADRGGQTDDVVRLLTETADGDRERVLTWLDHKLRHARSSARVRELLVYVLESGSQIGWQHQKFRQFLRDLARRPQLLREALRLGDRLDKFGELVDGVPDGERASFDAVVLQNYGGGPDLNRSEERYLLRFCLRLTPASAAEFRQRLDHFLLPAPNPNLDRVRSVASSLASLPPTVARGFAVDIGERMFNSLKQNRWEGDAADAGLFLGLRLLGDDRAAAGRIIKNVLSADVVMSPTTYGKDQHREFGVFFRLLHGLVTANDSLPEFLPFYQKVYGKWIRTQGGAFGRTQLLSFIQPGWHLLPEAEMAKIAQHVVPWLWDDEEFAKTVVGTIDQPQRSEPAWLKSRDDLRRLIVKQFGEHVREHGSLTPGGRHFLAEVAKACWPVALEAEQILANKIHRLLRNQSGRPDRVEEWRSALAPLCAPEMPQVEKELMTGLSTAARPSEVIPFALKTVWSDHIAPAAANEFATALLREPKGIMADKEAVAKLREVPGFADVARVLFKQMQSKGPDWMREQQEFLQMLSRWAASNSDASRRFQEAVVDTLLSSSDASHGQLALDLLGAHQALASDVRLNLAMWAKKEGLDAAVKRRFEEALAKESF